jgi:hypothetical protein
MSESMNQSMSILLATTILALGGLGLYMYKSSTDDNNEAYNEEYNEESIFGGKFWGFSDDTPDEENIDEEETDFKQTKKNVKTQKNRKSTGSSRRRY